MELIPGVEICYNDRHPKPPTPPPKDPTPPPPKEPTPPQVEGVITETISTVVNADGTTSEVTVVTVLGEGGQLVAAIAPVEPEVPQGPPPPPPPFEYSKDLPPEGAEVPYVKNYEPPPPEPAPIELTGDEVAPPLEGESIAADGEIQAAVAAPSEGGEPVAPLADGAALPPDVLVAVEGEVVAAAPANEVAPPVEAAPTTDTPATEPVDASASAPLEALATS